MSRAVSKWQDRFIYRGYQLAKEGYDDNDIARTLGVGIQSFRKWVATKPAFAEALAEGRKAVLDAGNSLEQLYRRLPEELQDVWDRVEAVEPRAKDDGEIARDKRQHRRMLDDEIRKMALRHRQQLYLYALAACNFNNSEACRKANVSPDAVGTWMKDKGFAALRAGIQEAKKDLVEGALIGLIKQGDSAATIFANKTLNRDRGYSDKITVNVEDDSGRTLEQLGLTLEERMLLLEKIRQAAAVKALPEPQTETVDAEYTQR
jgi:hypothetical protein